jgi:hypothetical protein
MTIAEKIQISADETKFTLFKEGLFYKCYNEDALIFTENVKEYKVNAKYIKSVGADVLSLGFPNSVVKAATITFDDYHSALYTSAVNILELIQLHNIGKIKSKKYKSSADWISAVTNEFYIEVLPFTKEHT